MACNLSKLSGYKKDILRIYHAALESVGPERLVENAIHIDHQMLRIHPAQTCPTVVGRRHHEPPPGPQRRDDDTLIDLENSSLHIIGGGKSVLPMASNIAKKAIASRTTDRFSSGKLILPVHLTVDEMSSKLLNTIRVDCEHGARNNLPDDDSVVASKNLLELIKHACERDICAQLCPTFILLISGGGSACLTAPKHVSLEEKQKMIQYLVMRGAEIVDLNRVRRFFSHIKGGQLASYIFDKSRGKARVVSLIVSDVIGDSLEFIASGPSFLSEQQSELTSHFESMLQVLKKFEYPNLGELEPMWRRASCGDSALTKPDRSSQLINHIIGNNSIAIHAAIREAQQLGYRVEYIGNTLSGHTGDVVDVFVKHAHQTLESCQEGERVFVIGGGETTVKKKEQETWGLGGRVQEMALDYLLAQSTYEHDDSALTNNIELFFAGSTDGQDGPTDVAACMASKFEWLKLGEQANCYGKTVIEEAKRTHNSNVFWNQVKPDWLVKTGPTQSNVMDLYMMILSKERLERPS